MKRERENSLSTNGETPAASSTPARLQQTWKRFKSFFSHTPSPLSHTDGMVVDEANQLQSNAAFISQTHAQPQPVETTPMPVDQTDAMSLCSDRSRSGLPRIQPQFIVQQPSRPKQSILERIVRPTTPHRSFQLIYP